MRITGLETLLFGLDDVAGAARYLTDYGLEPARVSETGGRFEAIDGTAVVIAHQGDPRLPAPPAPPARPRQPRAEPSGDGGSSCRTSSFFGFQ